MREPRGGLMPGPGGHARPRYDRLRVDDGVVADEPTALDWDAQKQAWSSGQSDGLGPLRPEQQP